MYENKAKNDIKCFISKMKKFFRKQSRKIQKSSHSGLPHSQDKEISKEFCSSLPYFYTYPI